MPQEPPNEPLPPLLAAPGEGQKPIFQSAEDLLNRSKIEQLVGLAVSRLKRMLPTMWDSLPQEDRTLIEIIAAEEKADRFQVAAEWLVQGQLFREIALHFGLQEVREFHTEHMPNQFLALTSRGSIIIGDIIQTPEKERDVEYVRIPSRTRSWKGEYRYFTRVSRLQIGSRAFVTPTCHTSALRSILIMPSGESEIFSRIAEGTKTSIRSSVGLDK